MRRRRAKADFYDVWSAIFRSSFFGEQAEWCKKYNVEYLVHLNHEETMPALERSEGDYFRDNRFVQVPGIDNLSQLVPDAVHRPDGTWNINNNFPKLASLGSASVRPPASLGRRRRRSGDQRQVRDGFSTRARS